MPLEMGQVAQQIDTVAARLGAGQREWLDHMELALETLRQAQGTAVAGLAPDKAEADLRLKIARSQGKTTWLVALPVEGLDLRHEAPASPADFSVIGVDGSHIDVDRHRPVRCYLINVGWAALRYGGQSDADLGSQARLYAEERELVLSDAEGRRGEPVEGAILGMKRTVEEFRQLSEMVLRCSGSAPVLALTDGSLILWGLTGERFPEFVRRELLDNGLLRYLNDIRDASKERPISLASYISLPRSTDVVNTLRLALCPHEVADCDQYCLPQGDRPCDPVGGIMDRDLFSRVLAPGQRSGLFATASKVVTDYYGEQAVYFFYLRLEDEVARVEVPRWVAEDAGPSTGSGQGAVALVHSLALDQCRRGHGYPVALAEAHEQAVVTGADREWFWQTVDEALASQRLTSYRSAKSRSKSTRWV